MAQPPVACHPRPQHRLVQAVRGTHAVLPVDGAADGALLTALRALHQVAPHCGARLGGHHLGRGNLGEEAQGGARYARQRVGVVARATLHVGEPKLGAVAIGPLPVVRNGPEEVAADVRARGGGRCHCHQVLQEVGAAQVVRRVGDAVLGDPQRHAVAAVEGHEGEVKPVWVHCPASLRVLVMRRNLDVAQHNDLLPVEVDADEVDVVADEVGEEEGAEVVHHGRGGHVPGAVGRGHVDVVRRTHGRRLVAAALGSVLDVVVHLGVRGRHVAEGGLVGAVGQGTGGHGDGVLHAGGPRARAVREHHVHVRLVEHRPEVHHRPHGVHHKA
mmetsp:Transcript_36939/g.94464  ORF Transcript_36939/g.94464 Transcript_36939/m.94464 type:complete len:329 (+) Transcript_36939:216-1202(+)